MKLFVVEIEIGIICYVYSCINFYGGVKFTDGDADESAGIY